MNTLQIIGLVVLVLLVICTGPVLASWRARVDANSGKHYSFTTMVWIVVYATGSALIIAAYLFTLKLI